MKKFFKTMTICCIWFGLSCLITILLTITFRLYSWPILHLFILSGVIIPSILLKPKHLTIYIVIYLIFTEVFLLLFSPLHSFTPIPLQIRLGVIRPVDNQADCQIQEKIKLASEFMKYDIDISKIKIYYGGDTDLFSYLPEKSPLSKIIATTWGNYIYLSENNSCLDTSTIVHEFVHVWQYQHNIGFGIRWIPYWADYYWRFFTKFDSLYEYGGEDGISQARKENKKFRDFGIEQQASIVALYYSSLTYPDPSYHSLILTSRIFKNYQYFVEQEFTFNNPPPQ